MKQDEAGFAKSVFVAWAAAEDGSGVEELELLIGVFAEQATDALSRIANDDCGRMSKRKTAQSADVLPARAGSERGAEPSQRQIASQYPSMVHHIFFERAFAALTETARHKAWW